jgi:hypothetical protein
LTLLRHKAAAAAATPTSAGGSMLGAGALSSIRAWSCASVTLGALTPSALLSDDVVVVAVGGCTVGAPALVGFVMSFSL